METQNFILSSSLQMPPRGYPVQGFQKRRVIGGISSIEVEEMEDSTALLPTRLAGAAQSAAPSFAPLRAKLSADGYLLLKSTIRL